MFIDSWKEITGDQESLNLIQGCEIKFKSMPIQSNPPHPFNMSKGKERLVDLDVQNLLAKGAIEICSPDSNQFISNIFTIPKKDGGRRPVVDMRELNQFAEYLLFKMKDISQLKDILQRGDYMTKLYLQDAYLTIPVGRKSKIFLRSFLEGRALSLHMSTIRPLTISNVVHRDIEAGDCLSKIYGDSSANLLSRHLHNGRFSRASCRAHRNSDRVLESPGFVIKKKKSILKSTQTIPFLGFIVNSIKMFLLLPEEKLQKLKSSALSLLENMPTAREILSFLGQYQAALPALQMAPSTSRLFRET